MSKILLPIPSYGFDPSETAIPWQVLSERGAHCVFATPDGRQARADQLMVTGEKLGLFASLLSARADAREAYHDLTESDPDFRSPLPYTAVRADDFDGLLLPGGHDKGVKEYLESPVLQQLIVDFFAQNKPVGAICHGVVLAARSINPATGKSVLYGRKTTALLQRQELLAYRLTRRRLGDYYLTYPGLSVQAEVTAALADPEHFVEGPLPMLRDKPGRLKRGFAVVDGNYVSARWPGDAYNFVEAFWRVAAKPQNS